MAARSEEWRGGALRAKELPGIFGAVGRHYGTCQLYDKLYDKLTSKRLRVVGERELESIAGAPIVRAGPVVGGRCRVAGQHVPGRPPKKAHDVLLLCAIG